MTQRRQTSSIRGAVVLILIAVAAAVAPLPAASVERVYSLRIYPAVQQVLTFVSNFSPIALLDIAGLVLVLLLVVRFVRAGGAKQGFRAVGTTLLKTVAVVYLLFLVLWGLNYRRLPLEQKLDFDRTRVTRERAFDLAAESARRLNALHAAAHRTPTNSEGLSYASIDAQQLLGATKVPIFGEPKRSLLGVYFRHAAIDGMTNPIFLEIILNPDLLAIEKPEVLAHEWAHLAGYADESEANFVAWLTCLRGDPLAQYSGWLSAYSRAVAVLPRDMRARLPALEAGPRQDLAAIAERYRRSSPVVRKVARDTYDAYLKANRIEEGIRNYDEVLSLMLGTTLGGEWSPR